MASAVVRDKGLQNFLFSLAAGTGPKVRVRLRTPPSCRTWNVPTVARLSVCTFSPRLRSTLRAPLRNLLKVGSPSATSGAPASCRWGTSWRCSDPKLKSGFHRSLDLLRLRTWSLESPRTPSIPPVTAPPRVVCCSRFRRSPPQTAPRGQQSLRPSRCSAGGRRGTAVHSTTCTRLASTRAARTRWAIKRPARREAVRARAVNPRVRGTTVILLKKTLLWVTRDLKSLTAHFFFGSRLR